MTRVVIVGGGPGGYEAALVAAQLGADVTIVDRDGVGGSAVLTDCVPSKTLIATAEVMTSVAEAAELGVRLGGRAPDQALHAEAEHALAVDLDAVDRRVLALARAQSADIRAGVEARRGPLARGHRPAGRPAASSPPSSPAVAPSSCPPTPCWSRPGPHPRVLPEAMPDGERILTWEQLYDLERAAGAADRGRFRRHRCRVRLGVPGARVRRSCWSPRATMCCPARTPTRRR